MGIASLIVGLISILFCGIPLTFGALGIFLGLIAMILGLLGRRRLHEEGRSAGVAIGGIVTGVFGLLGGLLNAVLCLTLCGAAMSNAEEVSSGQEWAQQQAEAMANENNQGSVPVTPVAPAIPPIQGTLGTSAVPGVPGGQIITVGAPTAGVFTPGLPVDAGQRAYIDYTLNIAAPGNYTINLVSQNLLYDPYLALMQGPLPITTDDDGGEGLNSRITRQLNPGVYTVRVSRFQTGQLMSSAPFTLTVSGG